MSLNLLTAAEIVQGGAFRLGPISENFNPIRLEPYLFLVNQKYILPVLGEAFLTDMIGRRNPNPINYNPQLGVLEELFPNDPDLETLFSVRGLRELFGFSAAAEAMQGVTLQNYTTGVQALNIERGQRAQLEEIQNMRERHKEQCRVIAEALGAYLCENSASFEPFGFDPAINCRGCDEEKKIKKSNPTGFFNTSW